MTTKKSIVTAAVLCGVFLSALMHGAESLENFLFRVNAIDFTDDEKEIEEAVEQYNAVSASFYNTGGALSGLDVIPASQLVKRRLFKDITTLKADGLVMVFDRDSVTFTDTVFIRRDAAEIHTSELWAVALQDAGTRRPVFNIKAVKVQVRYLLYKGSLRDEPEHWIISRVDVYPPDETVPRWSTEPAL